MAVLTRNWRILAALLFAGVFITLAYLGARGTAHPPVAEASTETALLQAIATKDSDGDGLPDWEEALYGTDPNKVDTRGLGMTDGEAVAKGLIVPQAVANVPAAPTGDSANVAQYGLTAPAQGSLTDEFAQHFFTLYLQTKQAKGGAALTEQDTSNIATQAMADLSAAIAQTPDFKFASDLTVAGSGSEALKTFAAEAEDVLRAQQNHEEKSELLYLQDALNNDASALAHISTIAAAYTGAAHGFAVLSAPSELAADELALVNAFARMGEICNDFTRVHTDPLATMLALQLYPQAVLNLGNALIGINKTYTEAGVVLSPGTPGASFVNIIPDVAAKQQTQP